MHPRLKFRLFTTTLLLSLTPSLFPNLVGVQGHRSYVLAQITTAQNGDAEADKLFQEGVGQYRRGEYPKALSTYQRVLELRRQQNDKAGVAQSLNNMGEVYSWLR